MKEKNKKIPTIIVSSIIVILGIIGVTLALTSGFSSNVVIDTANLGVEYTGNLTLPSTSLYPIEDSEIDTNTENVLTINFTVKGVQSNPTDIPIIYDIVLSDLDVPEELKSEYLKWQLKKNGTIISTGSFSKNFDTIKDGRLTLTEIQQDLPSYNSTADSYEFKLWISESCPGNDMSQCGPEQDQSDMLNKTLSGKIEAILYTKSKQALVRNPARTSDEMLEYLGLTVNQGTPDFSQSAETDEGVFAAQDDYGTSYYFRGNTVNNYVYFAGFYWRVIRINGNGSIRMIYDGTRLYAPYEISEDRQIGTSAFNNSDDEHDGYNAYIGYMYGQIDANTYEETHANINNSTIKTVVDNWYKTNIVDKGYSEEIEEDVIYCNDRSLTPFDDNIVLPGYTNSGIKDELTNYMAPERINNYQPTMKCPQLSQDGMSTTKATKGNKALAYPVGLITSDEVMYAGSGDQETINFSYYLYTGNYYWTMSPSEADGRDTALGHVTDSGILGLVGPIDNELGVRPVLSLKSSVKLSGTGFILDPWVVQS